MKTIELETVIPSDGKLPPYFSEVFGLKARIIVEYQNEDKIRKKNDQNEKKERLKNFAGKINAFRKIEDPIAYQRIIRDEWTREWENEK